MNKSVIKNKSVHLPLELARGTRKWIRFPYTVLYDGKGPADKRVLAVIDKNEPLITISDQVDVRFLLLIGSVNRKAWERTKKALDEGIDPGAPGSAGNGNGRIA